LRFVSSRTGQCSVHLVVAAELPRRGAVQSGVGSVCQVLDSGVKYWTYGGTAVLRYFTARSLQYCSSPGKGEHANYAMHAEIRRPTAGCRFSLAYLSHLQYAGDVGCIFVYLPSFPPSLLPSFPPSLLPSSPRFPSTARKLRLSI
jgi:hypothetical protein